MVQVVELRGHLTAESLESELTGVTEPRVLVVDCSQMTSYTPAARRLFVSWNRSHRSTIEAVGIVTRNHLWRMVIAAMSLASSQRMVAFDTVELARTWATKLET